MWKKIFLAFFAGINPDLTYIAVIRTTLFRAAFCSVLQFLASIKKILNFESDKVA